jgi:hypothetical protein
MDVFGKTTQVRKAHSDLNVGYGWNSTGLKEGTQEEGSLVAFDNVCERRLRVVNYS